MKKYAIIPYDEYLRLTKQSKNSECISENATEENLCHILNSSKLSDNEKQILYNNEMNNYIDQIKSKNKTNDSDKIKNNTENYEKEYPVIQILEKIVPKLYINKAIEFYKLLLENNNISWNSNGEVTLFNNFIPNSNIIDLIKYSVTKIKTIPVGHQEYKKFIDASNLPFKFETQNEKHLSVRPKKNKWITY